MKKGCLTFETASYIIKKWSTYFNLQSCVVTTPD
jgi:hypothetical protein